MKSSLNLESIDTTTMCIEFIGTRSKTGSFGRCRRLLLLLFDMDETKAIGKSIIDQFRSGCRFS